MRDEPTRKARRIAAAIERNADDVHFDRIDWDTFGERNRALWCEAKTDPRVKRMVLGLLRKDPNWKAAR